MPLARESPSFPPLLFLLTASPRYYRARSKGLKQDGKACYQDGQHEIAGLTKPSNLDAKLYSFFGLFLYEVFNKNRQGS